MVTVVGHEATCAGIYVADTAGRLVASVNSLRRRGETDITVDMDGVQAVDATAVHDLARLQRQAAHESWTLRIRAQSPVLRHLLDNCTFERSEPAEQSKV